MKKSLTFLLLSVFIISVSALSCEKKDNDNVDDSGIDAMETAVFNKVNQYRADNSLSALTRSSIIDDEARTHSENMADGTVPYGHDGLTDRVIRIMTALGGGTDGAENIATGQTSADEVVTDWINSSAHKSNIVGNFTHSGVGIAKNSNGVYYYTQIFILK